MVLAALYRIKAYADIDYSHDKAGAHGKMELLGLAFPVGGQKDRFTQLGISTGRTPEAPQSVPSRAIEQAVPQAVT